MELIVDEVDGGKVLDVVEVEGFEVMEVGGEVGGEVGVWGVDVS